MRSDAGRGLRRRDPHRLQRRCRRWSRARAIRATACRSRSRRERCDIDIAYGGSCTAGKRDDFDHYHAVLSWAAERGLRVAPHVKLYLQFGTSRGARLLRRARLPGGVRSGRRRDAAAGLRRLRELRAGLVDRADQVTVSAINRNFPGRSGPGTGVAREPADGRGERDRAASSCPSPNLRKRSAASSPARRGCLSSRAVRARTLRRVGIRLASLRPVAPCRQGRDRRACAAAWAR